MALHANAPGKNKIFKYLSERSPFSFSVLVSLSKAFKEVINPLKSRYSRIKSSTNWYGAILILNFRPQLPQIPFKKSLLHNCFRNHATCHCWTTKLLFLLFSFQQKCYTIFYVKWKQLLPDLAKLQQFLRFFGLVTLLYIFSVTRCQFRL